MDYLQSPPLSHLFASSRTKFALYGLVVSLAMSTSGYGQAIPHSGHRFAIVIHGGASPGPGSAEQTEATLVGLRLALQTGRDILADGGSSLDAVEQAIRVLEDAPAFNAGKGSVYNAVGGHQLDASIMNGADRSAGAVAAIMVAKNPISVARRVMTDTRHVLLNSN